MPLYKDAKHCHFKDVHGTYATKALFIFFINTTSRLCCYKRIFFALEKHKYVRIKIFLLTVEKTSQEAPGAEYDGTLSNVFSSRAVSQILDFFLDHKEFDYSPGEIAKKTGLSFRTIFRELPSLETKQLIYISRKIGKTSMYRLNGDFQAVRYLEKFALEVSQLGRSEGRRESGEPDESLAVVRDETSGL